jgi:hypothetical protein
MKALFDNIAALQPRFPGWCTLDKAFTLASMVIARRPLVSVEIGVYGGSSFFPIAMAHKAIGRGIAVGVDPWDKHVAVLAQTEQESREWWANQDLESLYQNVLLFIKEYGLQDHAKIQRKKSSEVDIPPGISLLHIDGAHNDEAVRDVARFCQHVEIGGMVVMDDLNWHGGGPARAAQRLVQIGFNHLYQIQNGAVYQRVR